MPEGRSIVAIGLLTQRELDSLGRTFDRAFPVDDKLDFDDILRAIDEADRRFQQSKSNFTGG